jgi:hypothetical protein
VCVCLRTARMRPFSCWRLGQAPRERRASSL